MPLASKVKEGETLAYTVSTKRVASCGGFVTSSFTRKSCPASSSSMVTVT